MPRPLSDDERIARLERWQRDISRELRGWEEWHDLVKPFIEQLQADLVYRQRRHADGTRMFSRWVRVTAWAAGLAVAVAAIGSFILQIVHAAAGG